jgi:hypothetical protein
MPKSAVGPCASIARPHHCDYIAHAMKRRQVVLRCLVLAAMMLSFGESVWASTCAAMSMMAAAEEMAETPDMPTMPGMPHMPGDDEQQDSDPWCPLGPAALAQGCMTAVPLPAASAQALTAPAQREHDRAVADVPSDLLVTTTLFHPPRV